MLLIGPAVVSWVAKQTSEFGNFGCATGIGWGPTPDEIHAGVAYCEWNGVNVVCHIASDRTRRWLTRQYLWTIFDYPFRQLNVNRITVTIGEGNMDSRRLAEHLGFELEATLKSAHPSGDLLVYRMFKHSCRWLQNENLYPLRLRLAA